MDIGIDGGSNSAAKAPGETPRFRKAQGRAARGAAWENGEVQLDPGPLPGLIGYALRRAQVAVYQDFARTYAKFDIRPVQYGVLTIIERNPGHKQTAVGAALGIKRANFVALCDELERRNLIVRRHIPNDRRSYALHLTPKGEALLKQLHQANAEHEARIAAALGAGDRGQFH